MPSRRLKGGTTAVGLAAAAMMLSGCADGTYDATETCVDNRKNPPVVAHPLDCERDPANFGAYSWQLPNTQYDEDGNGFFTAVVIPPVGQPVAGGYPGPARISDPARVSRPSAGSTISRGGLGVSGYGGSSGS